MNTLYFSLTTNNNSPLLTKGCIIFIYYLILFIFNAKFLRGKHIFLNTQYLKSASLTTGELGSDKALSTVDSDREGKFKKNKYRVISDKNFKKF